jgi:putative transposase
VGGAPAGNPARPWLTVVEDDHSRAIAGYAVNLGAPSALQTALVLRQAIWRKAEPGWHVCGIPGVFYTDHGSDFTSRHIEQAAAGLGIRLVFSLPGQPRGRGKVERYMDTINQMCLAALPGYAPRGTKDRAGQATLSLAELDAALGAFIVTVYNNRVHSETGQPPQARWEAGGFLPRLPESLDQLDLLLLTVAKPRKIHPDGIRFQGLRYLDPLLAAYVGETVIIRYDPRDLAEIRVFHRGRFLTRAICPDLAASTVSLKEVTAARSARRRKLKRQIGERASVVDRLIAVHTALPANPPTPAVPAADQPARGSSATGRSKPTWTPRTSRPRTSRQTSSPRWRNRRSRNPSSPALSCHPTLTSSSPRNTDGSPSSPPQSGGIATSACATARPVSARPCRPAAPPAGMNSNHS